jgi:hypothetical protein
MLPNSVTSIASSLSDYSDYVLAEIRCAVLRAKLLQNDLTAIGLALKDGFIGADAAVEHLWDSGALRMLAPPSSAITVASS